MDRSAGYDDPDPFVLSDDQQFWVMYRVFQNLRYKLHALSPSALSLALLRSPTEVVPLTIVPLTIEVALNFSLPETR